MPKKTVDVRTALGGGYVKPIRVAWPQPLRWSREEPTLFSPTDWMPQLAGSEEQGAEEPVHLLSDIKAGVSTIDDKRLLNCTSRWYDGGSWVSVPGYEVRLGGYEIIEQQGTIVSVCPTHRPPHITSLVNRQWTQNNLVWIAGLNDN